MHLARPALPPLSTKKGKALVSVLLALLLALGAMPLVRPLSAVAVAEEPPTIPTLLHFKDSSLETVDFNEYLSPFAREGDCLAVSVHEAGAPSLDGNLRFSVYRDFAAFQGKQVDITEECSYDADQGIVLIPSAYEAEADRLAIVFWLATEHPAYQHFVTAHFDTADLAIEHDGQTTMLRSDIVCTDSEPAGNTEPGGGIALQSAPFPGNENARYQLNPYTRLEDFDRDQVQKQQAYGYYDHWIGSYSFGVLFGTHREFSHGSSGETNWDAPVLDTSDHSFDEVVEAYLSDTIAARLGNDAAFAISLSGKSYRDRCVTKGGVFQDSGYPAMEAPTGKALARGNCGSSDVNNGAGTPFPQVNGDNYIAYKGIYHGSQTQYDGWYAFFYKFDTKSSATGNVFQDVVGYLLTAPNPGGRAQLTKVSSDPAISNANGNYALEGGVFAAFLDEGTAANALASAQSGAWKTPSEAQTWAETHADLCFVTQADGTSPVVEDVEPGTYQVVELLAPKGFRLATAMEALEVSIAESDDDVSCVTFEDVPQFGSIDLLKTSNDSALTAGNPSYSLDGARYGVYTDSACQKLFTIMTCSLDGEARGYARADRMPIGSYWVKEMSRPAAGYALDGSIYPVSVSDNATARVNGQSVSDKAKLNPIDLLLVKKDAQSQAAFPQGNATLGDAHFRIDYYAADKASLSDLEKLEPRASWVVRTNDQGAFPLQSCEESFVHTDKAGDTTTLPYKVSGPSFYRLSDGTYGMPLGTYLIQEVRAPEGYLLDPTIHLRHITDANSDAETVETFQAEQGSDLVTDRVARADLKFLKRAEGASKLAGIPFKITSQTTGEWHILVTDKNGMASTAATAAHPHSWRTNENDRQFQDENGNFAMPLVFDPLSLDAGAGLWFGLGPEGEAVPVDDALGALPYDTYLIEELRCPANALYQMICDDVVVDLSDEGTTIDLGTLDNTRAPAPSIKTNAFDGISNDPSDSAISADAEAIVIDRVSYSGLAVGSSYELEGILMDRTTGEPALSDGEPITATLAFVPESPDGFVDVRFTFDASALRDCRELVAYETLWQDAVEVASHRDLNDQLQTVTVNPISIGTTARDSISESHEGVPADEVTIIDAVTYQGLVPHTEYRLSALIMDKATGEPLTYDGQFISAEKLFVPEEASGTVEVELTLPGLDLDGMDLVVFEYLYHGDLEIANHADIEDEGQTVSYRYPDLPLPPTGGSQEEEPAPAEPATRILPLAKTGDEATTALIAAAVLCAGGIALMIGSRRRNR